MVVRAAAAAATVIIHGGYLLQAAQKLQPEVMPSGRLKWHRQAKLDLGRSTKIEPQDHYVAAGKVCTPYTYTLAYMPAPVIEWYHMPRCADERGEGWIRPARRLEPRGFQ